MADLTEILSAIDTSASVRSAVLDRLATNWAQETLTAVKASETWQG